MGEEEKKPEKKETPETPAAEEKKSEECKDSNAAEQSPAPPPPPPEIVLGVYMHCEGCARKVRKSLKGFDGVEEVITDCKTHKVVVKGEKADPLKVVERVQRKNHRHVQLLSPLPPPPPPPENPEAKSPEEKEPPKPEEEKKEEPKVISVVLKIHMHCEACALEIKRRIQRMKEVEEATPDLKSSQVTVKGTFDPQKLVDYVYKRTGKHAVIVNPVPDEKKEEEKGKDEKQDAKTETGEGEKKEGGGGEAAAAVDEGGVGEEAKVVDVKRNELYYYPQRYAMEMYAYPPQIFSDENPNSCSIM